MKLEIDQLCKTMGRNKILSEITASITFDILGMVGPSGSGKSTLLRVIAGLVPPDRGTITLNGENIPFNDSQKLLTHRRSLGIVFQSWNLFPHLNALENIVLPLFRVHGYALEQAREEGRALLSRFGLLSHASKKPHELSGGQCQRVAIIRAVASKPFLLLLDEPTSALDPLMTSEVLDLIAELKKERIACIFVSHHINFLKTIADKIAFIDRGKWVESGKTEELLRHPKHPAVQEYVSKVMKY
jgi:polar amino acid transport system ATP-binding protein